MNKQEILNMFMILGLKPNRIIAQDKNFYWEKFPDNEVYFDANIVSVKFGKIWQGDLDLTFDAHKIENIAKRINEDLYVLTEFDTKLENEKLSPNFLKTRAVWFTKIFDNS